VQPINIFANMNIRMLIKIFLISFLIINICDLCLEGQASENKLSRLVYYFSIPIVHNDILTLPDSILNDTKFLGFTVGIGYYLRDVDYVSITFGTTISNGVPFPMAVDQIDNYYWLNSGFIELSNNHVVHAFLKNKLQYLLGINYTYYDVYYHPVDPYESIPPLDKSTLGITLGIKYRTFRHWMVAIKLNSSLYNFTSNTFEYNHIAYLDFIYRFGSKRD
jgi:hypothetical protein